MRYYWGLDICRAIAVLLVFSVHYLSLFYPETSTTVWQGLVLRLGHSGVDLFFVLSGYLLYGAFLKRPDQPRLTFLKNRAWRIFPAYWVALSAYALAMFVVSAEPARSVSNWWLDLTKNMWLLPMFFNEKPWMAVSWTLTFEWGWYLLLPILFSARFHQLSKNTRTLALAAATLFFGIQFGANGGPEQISLFFAGALLSEHQQSIGQCSTRARALWCALLLSSAIVLHTDALWIAIILSGAGWVLCLSLALSTAENPVKTWLPAIFLGKISYSFYLWHSLALHAALRIFGEHAPWWLTVASGLSLSIALAMLSYKIVEVPALSFGKK